MADIDQLEQALRNADAAGDTEAAQMFAAEIQKSRTAPSPQQIKPTGFWDEHPHLRTAARYGVPLAAGLATMPLTGGMSLPAILAAEMGVQGATELGLQGAGVNEVDPKQGLIASAATGAGRGLGGILANAPKYILPGFSSSFGASIADDARGLFKTTKEIFDKGSVGAAYNAVNQGNTSFRMTAFPSLQKSLKKLEDETDNIPVQQLVKDMHATGMSDLLQQIQGVLKGSPAKTAMQTPTIGGKASLPTGLPKQPVQTAPARPPGLTFDEGKATVEGLGSIIRNTSDPKIRGVYQQLYKGMLTDMEKHPMPSVGGAPMTEWKAAREAAKYKYAEADLLEQTEKSMLIKDGIPIFDPNKVIKWLNTNDSVKSRVTPTEFRAIKNEYRMLASMKGHDMSKLVATLVGGFSGGTGGAAAAYIGSEALSKAMMTETGRKGVRSLITNPSESNFRRFFMLMGAESGAGIGQMRQGGEE